MTRGQHIEHDGRSSTATRTLPALAAVALPARVDPQRAAATLTAAINGTACWPMTAELSEVQRTLVPRRNRHRRPKHQVLRFVVILRLAVAAGSPGQATLLGAATESARTALRSNYGERASCLIRAAGERGELDLCWHSIIGSPRYEC